MVLHHITNNTKLIKVATSSLSAKRLLEGDNDIVYTVTIPERLEDGVSKPGMEVLNLAATYQLTIIADLYTHTHTYKPEQQQVLHHLLSKVVINSIYFLLCKETRKMATQFSRAI